MQTKNTSLERDELRRNALQYQAEIQDLLRKVRILEYFENALGYDCVIVCSIFVKFSICRRSQETCSSSSRQMTAFVVLINHLAPL